MSGSGARAEKGTDSGPGRSVARLQLLSAWHFLMLILIFSLSAIK